MSIESNISDCVQDQIQLTDLEGERGDVGEAERSLPLSMSPSAPALAGGASPFDFAETGVTGRAGVVGVGTLGGTAADVGGACSTVSFGRGIFPYLRSESSTL